ncbi:unnamed protein product [Prunus armeniaca]
MLKLTLLVSSARLAGPSAPVHPARIFTPGAIRSGLSTVPATGFGPRELNVATTGEGSTPNSVYPAENVAFGLPWETIYLFIASPAFWPTTTTYESTTSSSP